jgi:hypothetical protein
MKSADVLSNSNPILLEIAQYYAELMDSQFIWHLAERGDLFSTYNKKSSQEFLIYFNQKVNEVVGLRRSKLSKPNKKLSIIGRYLLFNPSTTMFDGLSEEESSGFFDVCDVPPPEFWVGVQNHKLVSFIPFEFMEKATAGVDNCISGSLEWLGKASVAPM